MMMEAYARLLGAPQLRFAHTSYEPPPTKVTALLYYLAYKGEWCSRDELLYLFYADTAEDAARRNLRQLLVSIRRLPYSQGLVIEASRLRWPIATDVQAFKQAVSEGRWAQAVELYGGELLKGVTLMDAPEFVSWLELEREELREMWREAVLSFAGRLEEVQRFADAAELLEGLYEADPLDEAVLRAYLTALYRSGERAKAFTIHEGFVRTLKQDLDGEPEEATRQLIERIKKGEPLGLPAAVKVAAQGIATIAKRSIPLQATPFIGRQDEKVKLTQRLQESDCRLLTIVGPGGMGKTRLAIEVAEGQGAAFADGVTFISFAAISSPSFMVSTMAEALDYAFFGPMEPKRQLLTYLQNKEMLLVLDNLEHLLADMSLITELLEMAPGIKLLATSREALRLHAEWVFDIEGLSYVHDAPQAALSNGVTKQGDKQAIEAYDAMKLFVQSASRVRADFLPDESMVPAIMRICQLVEGMPLALELAAAWLRVLPLEEIAGEIEQGLDLLEASAQDMPPRHKSLRAVFDYSWELLSEGERKALRKLSVFRGGFTREAAAQVADVSLPLLLSLSNKSLLKATASRRFERHPLVWQYSLEQAKANSEELIESRNRHCAYYAAFLHEQERWIHGGEGQIEAFSKIEGELDNIRAAWRWAVAQGDVRALDLSLESLTRFYSVRALSSEGEEAFRTAAECLTEDSVTLSRLLVAQGIFTSGGGQAGAAQELLERSIAMLERLGAPPSARALLHLGMVHDARGNLEEGERLHLEGLAVAKESGDMFGMACNLNQLAIIAMLQRALEKAERLQRESIAIFRQSQDSWGLSMALNNLGAVHDRLGQLEATEACLWESLEFARKIEHQGVIAVALMNLGGLSYRRESYQQAEAYYLESLPIWKRLDDSRMVLTLTGLGDTAHALGDYTAAMNYFAEALIAASRLKVLTSAVESVVGAAELLVSLDQQEKALLLIEFSLRQQEVEQDVKDRTERLHARLIAELPDEIIAAAQRQSWDLSFEDIQKMLLVLAEQLEQRPGSTITS